MGNTGRISGPRDGEWEIEGEKPELWEESTIGNIGNSEACTKKNAFAPFFF